MFYKDERLALFIDGSNLYAAAKALGFDIDYKLLRQEFMRRGRLLRAFYYTALLENDEYSPIRPLVDWLNYNGFTMVTKPAKEYTDSQGRRKVKGNMDIELAVDAMELAPRRIGLIGGLFYGLSFGLGGVAAAILGEVADHTSIDTVYRICSFLPAIGLLAWFLPKISMGKAR
jgi:hypothetical protein